MEIFVSCVLSSKWIWGFMALSATQILSWVSAFCIQLELLHVCFYMLTESSFIANFYLSCYGPQLNTRNTKLQNPKFKTITFNNSLGVLSQPHHFEAKSIFSGSLVGNHTNVRCSNTTEYQTLKARYPHFLDTAKLNGPVPALKA